MSARSEVVHSFEKNLFNADLSIANNLSPLMTLFFTLTPILSKKKYPKYDKNDEIRFIEEIP